METASSTETFVYENVSVACGVIRNGTDITVFDCRAMNTTRLCIMIALSAIVFICCLAIALRIVLKLRHRAMRKREVYTVDVPPSYSDLIPPTYEWAIKHMHDSKGELSSSSSKERKTVETIPDGCFTA